jgi:XapX domain-containing protein
MLISFLTGLTVGAIYALLRVRSPAPPLVALAGLLGMVWGEQLLQRLLPPKLGSDSPVAASELHGSEYTSKPR